MNTLLITGTIKPHCDIPYNNVLKRNSEYERNIERYITQSDFQKIVFAENSGFPFPAEKYQDMAAALGKQFEYLDVSATAEKENISVGDAKIMADAIRNSQLIRGESTIWKVSGRIWIRNVNAILKKASGNNIFLYARRYDSVQTWFFKASVEALTNVFLQDSVLDRMRKSCIEYVWKDCWEENKDHITLSRFPVYPDVEGINSSGQPYTVSRKKLFLRGILLKLGLFTVKERRSENELAKRNRL